MDAAAIAADTNSGPINDIGAAIALSLRTHDQLGFLDHKSDSAADFLPEFSGSRGVPLTGSTNQCCSV